MKQLRPVKSKPQYATPYEKKINKFFDDTFYKPIIEIVKEFTGKSFTNSIDVLQDYILMGKIQYANGLFTGVLNANISKTLSELGAKWSKSQKGWLLPKNQVPNEIMLSISTSIRRFEDMHEKIINHIDGVNIESSMKQLNFEEEYKKTIGQIELDFEDSVKPHISIAPKLTADGVDNIVKEYATNLNLTIKSWSDENVIKLRSKVLDNTFSGYRAEKLVKDIQINRGVSEHKARFIAKQETSLLTSQYREERYKDVGIQRYTWSTSKDGRVRDRHKELDGKIFFFDNPPISSQITGERNNPGEDFGCRCVAIPIVE